MVLTTDRYQRYHCRLDDMIFQDEFPVSELSGEVDMDKLKDGFGCRPCIQKLTNIVTAQKELELCPYSQRQDQNLGCQLCLPLTTDLELRTPTKSCHAFP